MFISAVQRSESVTGRQAFPLVQTPSRWGRHRALRRVLRWTVGSRHFVRLLLFSCSGTAISSVSPWTVAHQAPLSLGFPRQEYWSGLPFPSPSLYIVVYICQSQSPNSFNASLPSLGIHKLFSLCLCLYFWFSDKLICTILLDSIYKQYYTIFVFLFLT